eukprot:TRINITY_DN25556_c0_g1_i1.p1 TRINITY_DN25556_c0_g1~~TRINITY_DN25556_c0_g1_i1.p1  ORF type:complete len:911 (+),score=82.90 TRINITY_DN25556_c0_g1_i1:82-2733(+)
MSGSGDLSQSASSQLVHERYPWSTYSPLVLGSFTWWPAGSGRVDGDLRKHLQRVRLAWITLLILLYGLILSIVSADRQITAGVRGGIVDEFFPDAEKVSERIRDGEVSPGGTEFMHADDVAGTLAWFTSFCRMKQATDDHIKDTWSCSLTDINFGETSASRWDATDNRGLPDDKTDNIHYIQKEPVLNFSVSQERTNRAQQRMNALEKICSRRFLTDHFAVGDDPVIESKSGSQEPSAGFRDPKQFSENFLQDILPGFVLANDFEELGGDPYLGLDSIELRLREIKRGVEADTHHVQKTEGNVSRQPLASFLEKDRPRTLKKHLAHNLLAQNATLLRHAGLRNRKASRQSVVSADGYRDDNRNGEKPAYNAGCFDRSDIGGVIRQVWEVADRDEDLRVPLDGSDAKTIVNMLGSAEDAEVLMGKLHEHDADKDGIVSIEEYYSFVQHNLNLIKMPGRGYLTAKCRNHHFGLIGLCKPSHITASYIAKRVRRQEGGVYSPLDEVRVNIFFRSAGMSYGSGWYNFQYEVTTVGAIGDKGLVCFVMMSLFLLLGCSLFALDFLATVVLLPLNICRLRQLRIPAGTSFADAKAMIWSRVNALLDHFGCRCRYISFTQLCLELSISILLVVSIALSVNESLTPVYVPTGSRDQECIEAKLATDLEWMSASFQGQLRKRGLTPLQYVHYCRPELTGIQKATEMMSATLFQSKERPYGFVLALMFLRACQCLEHSRRLRWLPQTLALARPRVFEFLVAYVLLVVAFAAVLHIQFGDLYVQYSSFGQSFTCLFLYSLGDTDRATDGLHPFIEKSSTEISLYLLAYTLIIVTICLNVFTTIVMDAYSHASGTSVVEKILQDRDDDYTRSLIRVFAENPAEWHTGDDDEEGKV